MTPTAQGRSDRRVIKRHLQSSGLVAVVEEESGPERVLELARSGAFECILLDYRFPTGNAFELHAELLSDACTTRPPIVLLTGSGDERIAAQSIKRGAQEYLAKVDLAPATLRRAIEAALSEGDRIRKLAERDRELTRMSFFDALTELPNRRLFLDRLEQALREAARADRGFAVLMMDLNLFKEVNDTYGHDVGDMLLREVSARLSRVVRGSDTVARFGGDEFAALLSTADSLEGALVVAGKICRAVAEPVPLGEHVANIGVSIGIALYPQHGASADTLLRYADLALYEGKRSGESVCVHQGSAGERGRSAARIARDLEGAVARDELALVYQPQVSLEEGTVIGAEALVRWRHPELGLQSASEFMQAAERSRVIEDLTDRVLERALAQAGDWHARGLDITMSVNLSPVLLERPGIVERVEGLLAKAAVPAHMVFLEVAEAGLMRSPEAAVQALGGLSELGVRLSIDDFGTGCSSLQRLRELPIDEIKIDGLFVAGLSAGSPNVAIIESILALGRAFGARVLAEEIESEDAWHELLTMGCRYGQGHHFARPMSVEDFEPWRLRWKAVPPNRRRGPRGAGPA